MSRTFYYTALKNGDIQIRERQPKGKPYVAEQVVRPPQDDQHSIHTLTGYDAQGKVTGTDTVDAWCGFDRGPKLKRHILALLT